MSVSSELYKVNVVGDGSTPSIAFNRKVFNSTDIKGFKYDTTTNVETALVNGTDFTVAGAGDTSSGVTITPTANIPTGTNWVIYSDAGNAQNTTLTTAGEFPAKSLEYAFDKLSIGTQEADGKADRALKLPVSDTASADLPNKADRASKVLGFDASGNPTAYAQGTSSNADAITYDQGDTGSSATTVEAKFQEIVSVKDFGATGDGSTDDYTNIQEAFDSGAAWVIFPEGTYMLSQDASIPSTLKRVTGFGATLKATNGNVSNPVLLGNTSQDDVIIEGITFDGNQANIAGFNNVVTIFEAVRNTITNCKFVNTRGIALIYSNCTNCLTESCNFLNCGDDDVVATPSNRRAAISYTGGGDRNRTIGNSFESTGLDSISVASSETEFIVSNNHIKTGYAGSIYVSGSSNGVVSGNYVSNGSTGGNGIDTSSASNVAITGNTCVANGASGILIANGTNITVSGNVCMNNYQGGTSVHKGGVCVSATGSNNADKIIITGNIVMDDQGASATQLVGIGTYTPATGTYTDIVVDSSNILKGYDSGGAENDAAIFEGDIAWGWAPEVGMSVSVDAGNEVIIRGDSGNGRLTVLQANDGIVGEFLLRSGASVRELVDTSSGFEITDTGSTTAVYHDSGNSVFKLKNNYGVTKSYIISLSPIL